MKLHYDDRAEALNPKLLRRLSVERVPEGKEMEGWKMLAQWPEHLLGFCLALAGAVVSFVAYVIVVPVVQLLLMPFGFALTYTGGPCMDEIAEEQADQEFLDVVQRAFRAVIPAFMPNYLKLSEPERQEIAKAWAECLIEAIGEQDIA